VDGRQTVTLRFPLDEARVIKSERILAAERLSKVCSARFSGLETKKSMIDR